MRHRLPTSSSDHAPEVPTTRENGGKIGFESKLWAVADKLRGHMEPSEYKHTVLGLLFLKYVSEAFQKRHVYLRTSNQGNPDDPQAYTSVNIPWIPKNARWTGPTGVCAQARTPKIGSVIDAAMVAIERANPPLREVLPKDFSRRALDKTRLGELVELIDTIRAEDSSSQSLDVFGRVYEFFLGRFAATEGNRGGEFYTPQSVVKLLVEMIEPYKGKVYDPCCGSGGMFVQSERFVLAHGGRLRDLSIYGQESNLATWRLAKMNLAVRGIAGDIRWNSEGSFRNDAHPNLRADFVLANPPFNDSDWGGEPLRNDPRWTYGIPPTSNANFAWVQHFLYHLSPTGVAGFVLANGALSLHQHPESAIRRALIEGDLVDCIVYLPTNLFYNTQISASLWFVTKNKTVRGQRNRRRSTLFIYAADLGIMTDRIHRELTDSEIGRIASTYRAWKADGGNYKDIPGFCKSASVDEIRRHRMALVPGRYVGFDKASRFIPSPDDLKSELQELRRRADSFGASSERAFSVLQELLNNG